MTGGGDFDQGSIPTRVLVLTFTDLVASTALKRDREHMTAVSLIRRHRAIVRELLATHGGREVDQIGDGFFVVFDAAHNAVRFAVSLQEQHAADTELPRVRVGIHRGQVEFLENEETNQIEVIGMAVDVAARIQSAARPGQILISGGVHHDAHQFLGLQPAGLPKLAWAAHGRYRVKGSGRLTEICEVGNADAAPLIAPDLEREGEEGEDWRPASGIDIPRKPGWSLDHKLGEGTYGEVWLGRKDDVVQHVFKFATSPEVAGALQQESKLFRRLMSALGARRDIAKLLDSSLDAPPYYLELEYARGGNLIEWAERRGGLEAIDLDVRVEIAARIADALAAAHSIDILHQDIKPANVLVVDDSERVPALQLGDFGVGVVLDPHAGTGLPPSTGRRGSGSTGAGTPIYMAPELRSGDPNVEATRAADLYSLGVLLFQLVVGDFRLFPEGAGWAQHITDEVLLDDITQCLAARPDDRLRDAGELARRLRDAEMRRRTLRAERRVRVARSLFAVVSKLRSERRVQTTTRTAIVGLLAAAVGVGALYLVAQARTVASEQFAMSAAAHWASEFMQTQLRTVVKWTEDGAASAELYAALDLAPSAPIATAEDWAAAQPPLQAFLDALHATSEDSNDRKIPPRVVSWVFADRSGVLRARAPEDPNIVNARSYRCRDWFSGTPGQQLEGCEGATATPPIVTETHLSEPFISTATGHPTLIAVSTPVFSRTTGEPLGLLLATIDLGRTSETMNEARETGASAFADVMGGGRETAIVLLDAAARVIIHPRYGDPEHPGLLRWPLNPGWRAEMGNSPMFEDPVDGRRFVIGRSPVHRHEWDPAGRGLSRDDLDYHQRCWVMVVGTDQTRTDSELRTYGIFADGPGLGFLAGSAILVALAFLWIGSGQSSPVLALRRMRHRDTRQEQAAEVVLRSLVLAGPTSGELSPAELRALRNVHDEITNTEIDDARLQSAVEWARNWRESTAARGGPLGRLTGRWRTRRVTRNAAWQYLRAQAHRLDDATRDRVFQAALDHVALDGQMNDGERERLLVCIDAMGISYAEVNVMLDRFMGEQPA